MCHNRALERLKIETLISSIVFSSWNCLGWNDLPTLALTARRDGRAGMVWGWWSL
jgi:hypothetical protein